MGNCGYSNYIFPVEIGIILNKLDKLITEVWQCASQCGLYRVVEKGTIIDEFVWFAGFGKFGTRVYSGGNSDSWFSYRLCSHNLVSNKIGARLFEWLPMKSRLRLKIYKGVKKIALRVYVVGLLTYLKFELMKLVGRRVEKRVVIDGRWPIWVRSATPDLRVAVLNLTEEFESLGQLFPQGYSGLIVDGGGYIGTSALKFSEMYPDAMVVTVEPSSENMSILGRNIAGRKNIVAINAALVPSRAGLVNLFDPGRKEWGYTIVEDEVDGLNESVLESADTITLEEISARFGDRTIGILKLDIEGGEKGLLGGGGAIDEVPVVLVELHDRFVEGCSEAFAKYSVDRWTTNLGGEKYLSLSRRL